MRKTKKWLALALALCMAVPNVTGLAWANVDVVQAAEETAKTWDEWTDTLKTDATMSVQLTGEDQKFDGTRVLDVSEQYVDGMKNFSTGSIIMRFKVNSLASHGVILGARTSTAALPTDVSVKTGNETAMVITNEDKYYMVLAYDRAGLKGPYSFADGNWHTVVLSSSATSGKTFRMTIDGQEMWSLNRESLLGMFTRQNGLDMVTIGGHTDGKTVVGGFNGLISDVIVTTEELSDADAIALSAAGCSVGSEMGSAVATTMLNINLRDNTWLFTGGEAVQGGFDQTRGIRNYIGQFEEYIRWRKIDGSPVNARQRFTFNTGKAGQTIADIVEDFDAKVAAFKTKAVVYMVGAEDYSQGSSGVGDFKTSLKSFIDKSLALKDNGAFVIVQKPFAVNDATTNANIESYGAAVDAVVEAYQNDEEKYSRILVVDHYEATKNDADFKANKLSDGKLNAKGHLAISKQFAEEVVNYSGTAYPAGDVVLNRVEMEQPEAYLDVQPTATAGTDSLSVVIPAVEGVTSWKYELDMDGTIVSGTADANTFEITGLVSGKDYVLKIQSADGKKQLVTTKGNITAGNEAQKNVQTLDEKQQKIVDMVNNTEEPMTWLFMGDSITHGSGLTFGYDGIAQAFEEFVKEGLGRTDDTVLNTAVANATTATTIEQLDQRLTNYNPDVISLMIGTNDCSSRVPDVTLEVFEENMTTILDTIKEKYPEASVIIRSMTPVFNDGNRQPYMASYMEVVKEMAEKYDTIYVDQYTALAEATGTYASWLPKKLFTDNLHPEANGHRVMTKQFIKACGLWTEDLPMTNLFYSMDIAEADHSTAPAVISGVDRIGISVKDLEKASALSLGDVVLKATSKTSGQTYETSVKDGKAYVVLSDLPGETTYTVEVSGHLTTEAKKVTFAAVEVTLSDDDDVPTFDVTETLPKAGSINVSAENMTKEQPLAAGTGGSAKFRIPALITLDNGDLLAAADARWTGGADWGGLDTIASVSSDNGETWYYSFPIWFPDTNEQYPGNKVATTAIDPVLVQGNDGTVYCIADMNPSGITTGDIMPAPETGYVEIDGTQRLVLTGTYVQPTSRNWATYGNPEDYEYYVGDFDNDGFAKVLNKSNHTATKWVVDEWYNIYEVDSQTNTYEPLTQTMANDTDIIQQNAFYKDSVLHVYNTGYLWLVTSKDNGRTWENPTILNTQIKREGEVALLASPGQGIVASNGDIIIPFYDHGDNQENASIIWSSDNGKTWTRSNDVSGMWSSESEVVEINNGVLRMFFRNGQGAVCYADFTKTGDTWVAGKGVNTGIPVCSTCNVSAIRYSEKIDGKVVVMVACPGNTGSRADGKIFTFLVDEENRMELYNTFEVNKGYYAYSCITELENGNLGLLWEDQATSIRYDEFSYKEVIGLEKNLVLDPGDVYVEEKAATEALEITQAPNEEIATVTSEFILEETTVTLRDHVSNTASSLESFSNTAGTAALEDAEIVFTKVEGNVYKAFQPATGKYLYKTGDVQLSKADSADTATQQVVLEPTAAADGTVTYKFYRASNNDRYTVFYNTQMNFNAMGNYNAAWADGSYELVLLEKQDTVSEQDVIPGYTRAAEITSGNTYLIAYIWTDGSVIVLYPDGTSANAQTKLVGDAANVAKNVITITGIAPGKTTATIGAVVYNITVNDPALSPSYAGNDLPTEGMKLTAGSLEPSEGSLEALFDGNPDTFYHSNWSGTRPTDADFWITIELPEVTEVSGLRYLPRQSSPNGRILSYEISYSLDGKEWTVATAGDWADDFTWKLARFDENVEAKYVKIFATDSKGDNSGRHLTGAELRILKAREEEKPDVPVEPPKPEVCEVFPDVKHGAWYEASVQYVYDKELMTGSNGLFKPGDEVSRAQFVTTLYRLAGSPAVTDDSACEEFPDVLAGKYYTDPVCWAYANGITTGSNGVFNTNGKLSRQQLATFLYRFAEYMDCDVTAEGDYSDMLNADQVAAYAEKAMKWAVGAGIISGSQKTDDTGATVFDLNPKGNTTRAQLAAILERFCEGNDL